MYVCSGYEIMAPAAALTQSVAVYIRYTGRAAAAGAREVYQAASVRRRTLQLT